MHNRFIVTPFFLDNPYPELESLVLAERHLNKPILPEGDLQHRVSAIHQALAEFVADTLARGDRPVSIAGDCCTAIGVLAGIQRAGHNPTLIWLDAHGDFNTWETSPSGFVGGMPLAMIVGRGEQTMTKAAGLVPLSETQVILTDGRDLDPKERQALTESEVLHLTNSRDLLNHHRNSGPLYVHFDTDIVNPNDAPAMSYATPGGPSAAELKDLFRSLAASGRILAVSMSAWNSELDKDGRTKNVCMELLHALIEQ